jgi:hypothetical protein
MFVTLLSAALIGSASLVIGSGVLALARAKDLWLAGPVGLTLVMALAAVGVNLPGRGSTGAALIVAAVIVAGVLLARRRIWRPSVEGIVIAALTVAGLMLPYLANGRSGVLGISFNNDLSAHLLWVEQLNRPEFEAPPDDYPLGPHAVVAAVADGLGAGSGEAFMGLMVAISVLTALTARSALHVLRAPWRVVASVGTALAYLAAAFYAEGAFKETLQVLFVLAFACALLELARGTPPRTPVALVPLALIAVGCVYNYSYFGLAWPVLTLLAWGALQVAVALVDRRGREVFGELRPWLPAAGVGAVVGAVVLVPEVPHMLALFEGSGTSPAASGAIATTNLGNLAGPLSAFESFNLWLSNDFRFQPDVVFRAGALAGLGAAATFYGLLWSLVRRELAIPAAAVAAGAIYLRAASTESPYLAAKALVIAAPLFMLLALRALLAPRIEGGGAERLFLRVAAVGFIVVAAVSSAMVLRSAQVGPSAHQEELASLRGAMQGDGDALMLVDDDFRVWELFGVPVAKPAGARPGKEWTYGAPYDFDSPTAAELDRFRWVISTRSDAGSAPPSNLRLVKTTPSYRLWERVGPTPDRSVLAEGGAAGAELDCGTAAGRRVSRVDGVAGVRPAPVTSPELPPLSRDGSRTTATLDLEPGRWQLSMPYISAQPLRVRGAGLDATLPANLDRPGALWRVGTIDVPRRGRVSLDIAMERHGLGSPTQVAYPTSVVAVREGGARTVPVNRACGEYVDWYASR